LTSKPLKGQVVLVTGAGGRVGRAIALGLAERGAAVAVHYNSSAVGAHNLVSAIRRKGGASHAFQADLMDDAERMELVPRINREMGTVSILVNNAASFGDATMMETTAEEWDDSFELNLKAPFQLSQSFAAQNRRKVRGVIVNISDWRGLRPGTDHFAYTIAKAALIRLTEAMALALAPRIRVNCIALGAILLPRHSSRRRKEQLIVKTPLKQMGSTQDVAAALVYLLEAPYVTGETIVVDGGRQLVS